MRPFTLVLGSRIFWALLLVGGTLGAIELDRRGLAPWQRTGSAEPVELPTVDLGEPGTPGAFDADPTADLGVSSGDMGFGDEFDFPSESELSRDRRRDDVATGRETQGDRFDFDERDLAAGFGDELAGGFGDDRSDARDRLEEPEFDDDREFGDAGSFDTGSFGDDLDDEPTTRGDDSRDDDFATGFDPLLDEPFEPDAVGTPTSRDRNDDLERPLDPNESYELDLEPVDEPPSSTDGTPARPTGRERSFGPANLVLDVSAPTRMSAKRTRTFEVVVRNTGGRPARDVVLTAHLDEGLEMPGRTARAARKRMGDLAPGETRRLQLDLAAPKPGRPCVKFGVTGSGLDTIAKRICVQVSAPSTVWNW